MTTAHERGLQAAANAIVGEMRRQVFEKVEAKGFDFTELEKFFVGLKEESDKGLVIISFAYIDTVLGQLYLLELNDDIKQGAKRMLGPGGPLETASNRIDMAAALYWISKETYKGLHVLRRLRNEMAHNPKSKGLSDRKAVDLIAQLPANEEPILNVIEPIGGVPSSLSHRQQFHVRTILICARMVEEMLENPVAVRKGLSLSALRVNFDERPPVMREIGQSAAGAVFEALDLSFEEN